jgi:hypothetical protein
MTPEEIRGKLGRDWSMLTLDVWRRCEYCDKRLIDDAAEYYYGSHIDHIVPAGGDHVDNLALACRACKFMKRAKNFGCEGRDRAAIIALARADIQAKRERNQQRMASDLELFRLLDGLDGAP